MRVFIGCSSQGMQDLEELKKLLLEANMEPVPWSNPETFVLSRGTWEELVKKVREVDAAVFLFREDDEVNRAEHTVKTTRDNVVLEFGLFSGALPRGRCAIAKKGNPWIPTDLDGVTYLSLDDLDAARAKVRAWVGKVKDDLFAEKRAVRNLNEEQIAAISRAMLNTGIPQQWVYSLMRNLRVHPLDVDEALRRDD